MYLRNISCLVLCFYAITQAQCQHVGTPHDIVAAELAFAKTAKDKNTRAAFIESFAKDGVVISKGRFVNAIEQWQKFPEDSALLGWWPVFADVASSGDLGYTTGPYEFYADRQGSPPVGFGYYSTVWKKENGEWKAACDIGISLRQPDSAGTSVSFAQVVGQQSENKTATEKIRSAEQRYTELLNQSNTSFSPDYFANEFRLHRPFTVPINTKESLSAFDERDKKFLFEPVDAQVSADGDMAFSYGNVSIEISTNGNKRTVAANYMRVWKNLNGEWKIVLDVIGAG